MNFKRDIECAVVTEITPAMAKELLATSVGNRRIRPWYVSQLAAAMIRGEWRVTSQGIGVDRNGNQRDAHHRLLAVIESGVTVRMVLVMGLRPDANDVTDVGMRRTTADLLGERQAVAAALRLAAKVMTGTSSPSVDQMKRLYEIGVADSLRALNEFCGAKTKYFASAPMMLAAVLMIMDTGDADFVYGQYRAMVHSLFDEMTATSQALTRQFSAGKVNANDTRDTLARGLRVFDSRLQPVSKIQVTDPDESYAQAKAILGKLSRRRA